MYEVLNRILDQKFCLKQNLREKDLLSFKNWYSLVLKECDRKYSTKEALGLKVSDLVGEDEESKRCFEAFVNSWNQVHRVRFECEQVDDIAPLDLNTEKIPLIQFFYNQRLKGNKYSQNNQSFTILLEELIKSHNREVDAALDCIKKNRLEGLVSFQQSAISLGELREENLVKQVGVSNLNFEYYVVPNFESERAVLEEDYLIDFKGLETDLLQKYLEKLRKIDIENLRGLEF